MSSHVNSYMSSAMVSVSSGHQVIWRLPLVFWAVLAMVLLAVAFQFSDGLAYMINRWQNKEEYSHGFIIPLVTLFLIWQKKDVLETLVFRGSWWGFALVVMGLTGFFIGELSSLYIIVQYSFLLVIYGLFLAFMGWQGFRQVLVPLLILLFMIPLPNFIYNNLSSELQLISSKIGVAVIRLFGISVYLEGNVIDLGSMQLQVVEACSGLRYLFPLMTLGFILAYFYKETMIKRVILFVSSIPITIVMNSIRIGLVGYTVEHWGQAAAEGLLHDFEGWVVFMSSFALLFVEAWLLHRLGRNRQAFSTVLGFEMPAPTPKGTAIQYWRFSPAFVAAGIIVLSTALVYAVLPQRSEFIPNRDDFVSFPLSFNGWHGSVNILEKEYRDILKLDDHIMADFRKDQSDVVNFYVAYYDSQRKGASAHSPRSCMPGGGWRIQDLSQVALDGVRMSDQPLRVNRVLIQKDQARQLVYYWFQQRGRVITNEYLVKWYLFWDSLTRNRSDGALVRLTLPLPPSRTQAQADQLLSLFAADISSALERYIPK